MAEAAATERPRSPTMSPSSSLPSSPKSTFFQRARFFLLIFGICYVAALVLIMIPFFQSHLVYLNAVRFPFFADFDAPEKYGLAPNKTLNVHIQTIDNETIGGWFILSDPYYHSLPTLPTNVSQHVSDSIRRHPTILFLHGNAATRATNARIQHCAGFTSRLSANVLAVDYRGFGDSTGKPSEVGLVRDARAGWDWLIAKGANEEDIIVVGHSLGTGVTSQLAAQFGREGINPRGVVLLGPFSSVRELLNTYNIFGFLPLTKPLAAIPLAPKLITWGLGHKFDSLSAVPDIKADVVIAHATNDWDIPSTHSEVLFEAFLDKHLPPLEMPSNPLGMSQAEWDKFTLQQGIRMKEWDQLVKHTDLRNFGSVDEFTADERKVVLVKTFAGGHDYVGVQEGVQDVIGRTFGLF